MWVFLALALAAGCRREEILVYDAPKDAPPQPPHQHGDGQPPHGAPTHVAEESPVWQLPEGWEPQSAKGIRAATFALAGPEGQKGEVAIMPFKRMNASDLQFVNLWRSTMQLQPIDEARLAQMVEAIDIGGSAGKFYDVTEKTQADQAPSDAPDIIVAMVVRGETSWFFKLAGDRRLVAQQKETFKQFLKSIRFEKSQATPASPPETVSAPAKGRPQWDLPQGWTEIPPTTMVLAKFQLQAPAGASAEVAVSVFPGDVGGLLANVNRWRGQLGLPPVSDAELPNQVRSLDVDGGKAMLVDMSGTDSKTSQPARLIGAIVPRGGQTWFYKLLGHTAAAEQHKEAFIKFVQSARHPDA